MSWRKILTPSGSESLYWLSYPGSFSMNAYCVQLYSRKQRKSCKPGQTVSGEGSCVPTFGINVNHKVVDIPTWNVRQVALLTGFEAETLWGRFFASYRRPSYRNGRNFWWHTNHNFTGELLAVLNRSLRNRGLLIPSASSLQRHNIKLPLMQ